MIADKRQVRRAFSRFSPAPAAANPPASQTPADIAAGRLWERVADLAQAPATILDIGGAGAFVAARYPAARVVAADFALPALRAAAPPPAVWRIGADAEALPLADETMDMAWSNLCAEWTDLAALFREAARVLRPGGLFAFTTVGPDTLREMRAVFAGERRAHEFVDMHDIADALISGGFAEPLAESDRLRFVYADAARALADARNMGGGCALPERPRGFLGKTRWCRACAEYAARFAEDDGRVWATMELLIITAWRREAAPAESPVRFYR